MNETRIFYNMSIAANNLTYIHADGEMLFQSISFTVNKGDKVSLVGNNGTGKSTLLQLIAGFHKQHSGEIITSGTPYYVPQHSGQFDNITLTEALKVKEKTDALHKILEGDVSNENMAALADDWEIEERIKSALRYWGIEHLSLTQTMGALSGGEKTKVFLAGIQIHSPELILLDEPSNHLDLDSRQLLYDFLRKSRSTILAVSHDRRLLNLVDSTIELSPNSANVYGGNYEFYKNRKEAENEARLNQLAEKEKTLRQVRQNARELAGQRQKQDSRGKAQKEKAGIPRILMGAFKNKAEQSSAKISSVQSAKIADTSKEVNLLKEQLRSQQALNIGIQSSNLHKGKILVKAEEINYTYGKHPLWLSPLSFQINSGDRMSITGANGSGKTTLIHIITKELSVTTGNLYIADCKHLYLDQEYSIIDRHLSVIGQVQAFNDRGLTEQELKDHLHHHRFPYAFWSRQCGALSGGEKMKLALCCMAVSNNLPDLLILDEPTNNLDIYSQEILTRTIQDFKGTVLVVSHDEHFIAEIGVGEYIELG